ncbi:hypothetical protein ACN28I_39080 [Archangium gephyra]|uniref:hypothetical protein n=1 Tax=Archangium gephyra TaxID=48 RepID=UPI003B760B65
MKVSAPRSLGLLLLLLATPAAAEHPLTVYSRAGAMLYLSDAQTAGGIGGGVGLRATFDERFFLQADVSYLMGVKNVAGLRLGAGLQRRGTYTPAVLLNLSTLVGDRLVFLTPQHPTPAGPALALGVSIAPLRFSHQGTQVSLLELGVGVGTDLPGTGVSWQLGLVEAGVSF